MPVEFIPDNQSSYGEEKTSFKDGTTISNARVFTEALPSGFPTKDYPLSQYPPSLRKHGKWVVEVDIFVGDGLLGLKKPTRPSRPNAQPSPPAVSPVQEFGSIIFDSHFAEGGLPVVIFYKDNLHPGRLHSTSSSRPQAGMKILGSI